VVRAGRRPGHRRSAGRSRRTARTNPAIRAGLRFPNHCRGSGSAIEKNLQLGHFRLDSRPHHALLSITRAVALHSIGRPSKCQQLGCSCSRDDLTVHRQLFFASKKGHCRRSHWSAVLPAPQTLSDRRRVGRFPLHSMFACRPSTSVTRPKTNPTPYCNSSQ
jgi:hypothetical protein